MKETGQFSFCFSLGLKICFGSTSISHMITIMCFRLLVGTADDVAPFQPSPWVMNARYVLVTAER